MEFPNKSIFDLEIAEATLRQVDLVRKQRRFRFAWRDVTVADGHGIVSVYLALGSDPRNITNWFKAATASTERLEYQQGGWWRVYFRLMEVEV